MEAIKTWLAKYTITSHTVAGAFTTVVLFYYANPQFHTYVLQAYGHLPSWSREAFTLIVAFVAWYKNNKKN